MKISLAEKYKSTINQIDFSEIDSFRVSFDDGISVEIDESDFQLLMVIITETIAEQGLENQNTINAFGKALYELYDTLLLQKPKTA